MPIYIQPQIPVEHDQEGKGEHVEPQIVEECGEEGKLLLEGLEALDPEKLLEVEMVIVFDNKVDCSYCR